MDHMAQGSSGVTLIIMIKIEMTEMNHDDIEWRTKPKKAYGRQGVNSSLLSLGLQRGSGLLRYMMPPPFCQSFPPKAHPG
jgi:hypothetical protein